MSSDNPNPSKLSRRTALKGAAWAAPVIAVAVATPAAAASTTDGSEPNDAANYYWDTSANADFTTLDPAQSGNRAQFSTQISYRSEPWVSPPAAGVLVVTVVFSHPVTITNVSSQWALQGGSPGPGTSFTFHMTSSSFGSGLTFDAIAGQSGELTSTATMSVLNPERSNGSDATWAQEPGTASATVNA